MHSERHSKEDRIPSASTSESVLTIDIIDEGDVTTPDQHHESEQISKSSYVIGVGFLLSASWAFAYQNFFVKKASAAGFKSFQTLLGRGIIQVLFTALIDLYTHYTSKGIANNESPKVSKSENQTRDSSPETRKDWMFIALVGLLGFVTAYCNYSGTQLLPQGDASSIFATFPIWTVILASCFLKEQIRLYHYVAMAFGVTGVVFIVKPSFMGFDTSCQSEHNYTFGVPLVLFAALCNAFAFLTLRKLKHLRAGYSVYSYGLGCIIGSLLVGAFKMNEWKAIDFSTYYQPTMLFTLGFCGFLGQYFKTKSLHYVPAGVASLIRSCDVLVNYILQVALFGDKPDGWTIFGAVCVTLPVIIISVAKLRQS